jgi:hypothetical protein
MTLNIWFRQTLPGLTYAFRQTEEESKKETKKEKIDKD